MNPSITIMHQQINRAIEFAFIEGDQDECFYKHIGHTLSAIYCGNGYKNVIDYRSPGDLSDSTLEELYGYWSEVEESCNRFGKNLFREVAASNPAAIYFDSWYIDQASELSV